MERLERIKQFKYYDQCGFFCHLYGNDRETFIVDRTQTPYAKSLLRILNSIGDKFDTYYEQGYAIISNMSIIDHSDDEKLLVVLKRLNRPSKVKTEIWDTVLKRKEEWKKNTLIL